MARALKKHPIFVTERLRLRPFRGSDLKVLHALYGDADVAPETRRYYQQLTRFSAALAFLADVSMGSLGGALKRKEKLSARLGVSRQGLYRVLGS